MKDIADTPPIVLCLQIADGGGLLLIHPLLIGIQLREKTLIRTRRVAASFSLVREAHIIQILPRNSRLTYQLQNRQQFCEASLRFPVA